MKTLYHTATRGNLYSIALKEDSFGYGIYEYKHGKTQGFASLGHHDRDKAVAEYNRRIDDAARYDQIFYTKAIS